MPESDRCAALSEELEVNVRALFWCFSIERHSRSKTEGRSVQLRAHLVFLLRFLPSCPSPPTLQILPTQLVQSHTPLRHLLVSKFADSPVLVIGGKDDHCRKVALS